MADKHRKKEDILDGIEVISTNDISSRESRKRRKKQEQGQYDALKGFNILQKKYVILGLFALGMVIAFLLSFFFALQAGDMEAWKKILVIVAVMGIEIAIGFLLDHNPIWLHAVVAVLNVIVGVIFGQIAFMLFMMLVYVIGIVTFEVISRINNKLRKTTMRASQENEQEFMQF